MKCILNPDEVENKTVPRQVFVRLKQELQEKNDTISTLQQKILHLENVMRLKDQRIDDLTAQIMRPSLERNVMSTLHSQIANGKLYPSKLP
jgi:predicted  nucleic acid-binding Zn-ribbon protein